MSKFKVGDTVRVLKTGGGIPREADAMIGKTFRVYEAGMNIGIKYPGASGRDGCWWFLKTDVELVEDGAESYTLPRPITIKSLLEKAPRCSEWNAEFVQLLKKYPEGVSMEQAESFFSEAPQKWIDWLQKNGFLEKAERTFRAGDRFKDDNGDEFLIALDDDDDFMLLKNYKELNSWVSLRELPMDMIKQAWGENITGDLHPID